MTAHSTRGSKRAIWLATAVVGLSICPAAKATLIAYEDFSGDTVGATLSSSTADGTGWASSPAGWRVGSGYSSGTVATAPGTFISPNPNEVASGAVANFAGDNLDFRQLANPITVSTATTLSPTTIFISALVEKQNNSNVSTIIELFDNTYTPSSVNQGGIAAMGVFNGGANWSLENVGNSTVSQSTVPDSNTNPVLLVMELSYEGGGGNDSMYLWFNPTGTTAPAANASFTGISLDQNPIDAIRFYTGATGAYFSNLAIGTTFTDVVTTPTPEPTGLALFGIPLAGLLSRRRRRPHLA